jgi:carbon-monoxide dehydrogenase medium subunit
MKPPPFTYHDPADVKTALDLLARLPNAKVLAGGQSLMPLLNMRLAAPEHVVDLNRIDALAYVREANSVLQLGAMTRQRDVEQSALVRERCPLLSEAVGHIGHFQTRNRGTIGGSLAHLDPAAELTAVASALDAVVHAESARGRRDIPFAAFPAGYLTSCLAADELLTGVSFPGWPAGSGHAFVEYARRHGDFAIVGVATQLALARDGTVARVALALTGVGAAPVRATAAEQRLVGAIPDDAAIADAATAAARGIDPPSDLHASRAYRVRLAEVLTRRALVLARGRARLQ